MFMNNIPTRPALRYYGGKWKLAPWVISFFPKHRTYVEPIGETPLQGWKIFEAENKEE